MEKQFKRYFIFMSGLLYPDVYNQESFEMPGSSYFKAGLRYRFKSCLQMKIGWKKF